MLRAAVISLVLATPAAATNDVMSGASSDPTGELNALFARICRWDDGTRLVPQLVQITDDGVPDYLYTFDLPCRGQENAFSGNFGTARQLWVSAGPAQWVRLLDVNARDLTIEYRDGVPFVILQHAGSYCMTADAAPCFLTLEYRDGALAMADVQHPSMNTRLKRLEEEKDQ